MSMYQKIGLFVWVVGWNDFPSLFVLVVGWFRYYPVGQPFTFVSARLVAGSDSSWDQPAWAWQLAYVAHYRVMSHLGGYFCCPLQGYVPHGRILLLPTTGLCPTWADTFDAHYRVMSHMGWYFCCPLQGHVPHGRILLLSTTGLCPRQKLFVQSETFLDLLQGWVPHGQILL
jgi:hypothetical protein